MGSIPPTFPVSLRSWPSTTKDNGPNALPTIIQRINFERGGFQNITEESLRQEIVEAELSNARADENESSDEEDEEEPDRLKEVLTARDEIIKQIDQAHQAAMLGTEIISAALSKDAPVQASLTMSQELRDLIGTGTIGMDKLNASRTTDAVQLGDRQAAKGWKIQSLNKSVDAILAAAERLKSEVERETIFWGQVLAVSDSGWAICRLPNDRHTLGVRFGFSESAPQFKNRSLGALRRNEDGTITLDQGLATAEPKTLRVRIQTGSMETGASVVPKAALEDAPVETLILEARNTIFAEELWQELNRESRSLGAFGVKSKDDTLICPLSDFQNIIIDLVPLGDSPSQFPGPDNQTAEGILIALYLFLSYAHRQSHLRRTQPPPLITNEKRVTPPYNLLRAFLTRLKHQETVSQMHNLMRPLCRALQAASVRPAIYVLKPTVWPFLSQYPIPERIIMSMTDRLETITTFTITEDMSVTITAQTGLHKVVTFYVLGVSPALAATCPNPPGLMSFTALRDYIHYTTSCALASTFSNQPSRQPNIAGDGWHLTAQSNVLKKTLLPSQKSKQLSISVCSLQAPSSGQKRNGARIRIVWEWMKGDTIVGEDDNFEATMKEKPSIQFPGPDFFDLYSDHKPEKKRKGEGVYDWVAWDNAKGGWDGGEGEVIRNFTEVMEEAGKDI